MQIICLGTKNDFMVEKQQTLKQAVTISGIGLHSGANVSLTLHPAPENFWYQFKRIDIEDSPLIAAVSENVVDVSRGTTLEKEGCRVATV
ncbi:MAG: UDP-3-O-acyl-N-acetylglucosamine deacetylase, partial [Bacteroidales bacterium]